MEASQTQQDSIAENVLYFTVEHENKYVNIYCDGDITRSEEGSQYLDHIYNSYMINKNLGDTMPFVHLFNSLQRTVLDLQKKGEDIDFMFDTKGNFNDLMNLV